MNSSINNTKNKIETCLYVTFLNGAIMMINPKIISIKKNQNKTPDVLPKEITIVINETNKSTIAITFEMTLFN
ncbi:hypothetical protein ATO12_04835 [Aquimarina atlantica]|uniref:Uncharacterized protein n=1 Tax=Aquimarina atlantica TaxID=1317122 RepID=A0A023BQI4_9FLAO|nr:hypothetical protein [Aquimarina atlantica]EZH71948.1 hypothetical protein ATO12_04835 [Aquimarina atlantica]